MDEKKAVQHKNDIDLAKELIKLIDLTCLSDQATATENQNLCQQAFTAHGDVAAICIWPSFITPAKKWLKEYAPTDTPDNACSIPTADNSATNNNKNKNQLPLIATVINFPHATQSLNATKSEIDSAIMLGADELDIVMPYQNVIK